MDFILVRWTLLMVVVVTGGCADSEVQRVSVAGRVLIDGQPLKGGTIRFVPESGRPASSAISADGSFALAAESIGQVSQSGIPLGTYRVQVSASKIIDDETIQWSAPEKYADFRTSGLNTTIDGPNDNLVVQLSWGDEKPSSAEVDSRGAAKKTQTDIGSRTAAADNE